MRAIVVDEKVIVLKHRQETERGCTLRAEKLAEQLGVPEETVAQQVDPVRAGFDSYMKTVLTGGIDTKTKDTLWKLWQAARK